MPERAQFDTCTGFVVRGIVDGRPSVACWSAGRLDAEPELIRRAEVMIGMGECFGTEDGPPVVKVSLDGGGYDVILTLMRAFTRVTSIELSLAESH